jgi:lipoprotein-anchoring transpeptidase ErfK/SrfK
MKQEVAYSGPEKPGTVVVNTNDKFLYLVQDGGRAIRYGIGVGRPGFTWAGVHHVSQKREWPDWTPPAEMLARRPDLPRHMKGGIDNPLGARALYLGHTLYRIHGTNQPSTIGSFVSSGCIRLLNEDIEDLYSRVQVGTRVVVLPGGKAPEHVANTAARPAANGLPPAGVPTNIAPANQGASSSTAISSAPLPPVR